MDMAFDQEKRQELRLSAEETIFIEVDDGGLDETPQIQISRSLDVSANGLQLVSDQPLCPGHIHRLCLQLVNPDRRFYLTAQVAWCRPLDDDSYVLGLKLLESQGTDVHLWKAWIAERWGGADS